MSDNVVSKLKLFTDDASMFSVVVDPINNSQKLSFKPDPSKQAQGVVFSRKAKKDITHLFYLIILPFNKYQLKNLCGYIFMKTLHSNIILM